LRSRWQRAVDEDSCDPKVAATIVGELIPSSASVTGVEAYGHGNRAQSINSTHGDVDWERLTTESLGEREVRDQDVLVAMQNAGTKEGVKTLGESIAGSKAFAEQVVFLDQFYRVDATIRLKVATVAIRKMRPLDLTGWHREPAPFGSLRRWIARASYSESVFPNWLIDEIAECIPTSIPDANALYFDFRSQLDSTTQALVRKQFFEAVRNHFSGASAERLASSFNANHPYSLGHLIRLDHKEYPEQFLTRARDWRWIAPLLVQGMKEEPQKLVPQVMMLFGEYGPGGQMPEWFKFDEGALRELFCEKWPEALSLLCQEVAVPETMEGWFRLAAPLAAKAARDLLVKRDPVE
jgi:hypothetical protein